MLVNEEKGFVKQSTVKHNILNHPCSFLQNRNQVILVVIIISALDKKKHTTLFNRIWMKKL